MNSIRTVLILLILAPTFLAYAGIDDITESTISFYLGLSDAKWRGYGSELGHRILTDNNGKTFLEKEVSHSNVNLPYSVYPDGNSENKVLSFDNLLELLLFQSTLKSCMKSELSFYSIREMMRKGAKIRPDLVQDIEDKRTGFFEEGEMRRCYKKFLEFAKVLEHPVDETKKSKEPLIFDNFKTYIAKLPQSDRKLKKEAVSQFLEADIPGLDEGRKREVLAKVNYVDFSTFIGALKQTMTEKVNPILNRPFIVMVDGRLDKSGIWVTKLAEPFLKSDFLRAIVTTEEVNEAAPLSFYSKDIEMVLLFDDASYSGNQMVNGYYRFGSNKSFFEKFPLVHKITYVPIYIGETALENLKELQFLEVIYGQLLPKNPFKWAKGATLSYFQHKFPDEGYSVVPLAEWGLVENFVPPYKN